MKNILLQITSEIEELKNTKFKDLDEVKFFIEYKNMVDYILCGVNIKDDDDLSRYKSDESIKKVAKKIVDEKDKPITVIDLFILCHRVYYQDETFIDFKNKIYGNDKILKQIINSSTSVLNYYYYKGSIELAYELNDDLIKNSIFNDERYIKTLKNILNILYIKSNHIYPLGINDKFVKALGLYELSKDIYNRYKRLINENNKFLVKLEKQKQKYINLLESLQGIKLPFIINATELKDLSEETIYNLYMDIATLNQGYYEGLIEKKKELSIESSKNEKVALKNCGFDIEKIEPKKLNFLLHYGNIKELVKIITFLNKLDYCLIDIYSDNGIYIMVNTTSDIVNRIYNLIANKIINLNFVTNNPKIFFKKDIVNDLKGLYAILTANVNVLEHNYDIRNSYANELLITNPNDLTNNINTLKKYNDYLNCSILKNAKLFDYLDLLIELGFSNHIQNGLYNITENSYNDIKKFYVAKLMNFDCNNLDSILKSQEFPVANEQIDAYIINDVSDYIPKEISDILDNSPRNIISNNELKQFEKYSKDNLTYDFNGILISKNKILRNLHCLENNDTQYNQDDMLFTSIIYGSILDYEQIDSLKEIIYSKKYLKKIKN